MIVSLELDVQRKKDLFGKLYSLFHPYDITAKIRKQNKVSLLQLRCVSYRSKMNLHKLLPFLSGCSNQVLCSSELDLKDMPLQRFESSDLTVRLMMNFVCHVLDSADMSPREIRIGLYDPTAAFADLTDRLLPYTSRLTVVSDLPRYYEIKSDMLMDEFGIPLFVSAEASALSSCDIVIAPLSIRRPLPISSHTAVFSAERPALSLGYDVFFDYIVDVPYKYQRIQPESLGNLYYLSALYTLCGVRELDKLVPEQCSDGNGLFSADRLSRRLLNIRKSA